MLGMNRLSLKQVESKDQQLLIMNTYHLQTKAKAWPFLKMRFSCISMHMLNE